jgi:hypothetical protein
MGATPVPEKKSAYSVHRFFTGFGPLPNAPSLTFDDYVRFGVPHKKALPFRCGPHQLNSFLAASPGLDLIPITMSQRRSTDLLSSGNKWFYEISLSHGLSFESGLLRPGPHGIWASVPANIRDDIRAGIGKLLITSIIEDTTESGILALFEALLEDEAPAHNVVLMTSAFHSRRFLRAAKETFAAQTLVAPVWEEAVLRWHRNGRRAYLEENDFSRPRKKKFIFLNRRMGADGLHRVLIYLFLLKEGLLEKGFVSMMWADVDKPEANFLDRVNYFYNTRRIIKRQFTGGLLMFGREYYSRGAQNLPLVLDVSFDSNANRTWGGSLDFMSDNLSDFFSESYFSIVGECFFDPNSIVNGFLISEKTFTAIMNFHFFLLVAEAGSLERLRDYGYKTFAPYVDETYDAIQDPDERIRAVTSEIRRLCLLPPGELLNIYQKLRPVIEHNRRIMTARVESFAGAFCQAINV